MQTTGCQTSFSTAWINKNSSNEPRVHLYLLYLLSFHHILLSFLCFLSSTNTQINFPQLSTSTHNSHYSGRSWNAKKHTHTRRPYQKTWITWTFGLFIVVNEVTSVTQGKIGEEGEKKPSKAEYWKISQEECEKTLRKERKMNMEEKCMGKDTCNRIKE